MWSYMTHNTGITLDVQVLHTITDIINCVIKRKEGKGRNEINVQKFWV